MLRHAPIAALAAGLLALLPARANANGRFPSAGQIVVDPQNPDRIVVRATYGVLQTSDGGKRWDWICEKAVGFGDYEDPAIAIVKDGTLLAGVFDGLSSTRDAGCTWALTSEMKDRDAVDVSVERGDSNHAVCLTSNGTGNEVFSTQFWESNDSAKTWTKAGVDLPDDFLGLNLDVAKSDPQRVYLSGRFGPPEYQGAIERSLDRGATWERFDIPGSSDLALPYLSAIDPNDPEILYVRLDGDPVDMLVVSKDGGATWSTIFESAGDLLAFALSPDGATVVVGGPKDGIWHAPTTSFEFERISDVGAKCFTWADAGLYACADEVHGFAVGLSTDGGKTFTPVMHLQTLCGPLPCGAETTVGKTCGATWGLVQVTLQTLPCDGQPTDGGLSTGSGETDGGGDSGCGCRAGAGSAGLSAALLVLASAIAARRRRRGAARGRQTRF